MSSDKKAVQSYIKQIQPKAEYTHCRNHTLNLEIAHTCKNPSIQKFMTFLAEAANFLETYPKRQQYFEHFIEFYVKQLGISESKIRHLKGLSKTRWVELHQVCGTFYLLHRYFVRDTSRTLSNIKDKSFCKSI